MLLDKWYKDYELERGNEYESIIMQVFCSFLDRNSLEFVFKLIQSDFHAKNVFKYDGIEEPLIIFIFFPVSRSVYINSLLESNLGEFSQLKPNFRNTQISKLLEKAHNVMQKRYCQYKTFRIQDDYYLCSPEQEKYKIDEFLFGDLAAKYLENIKQFPYIRFKNRIFEGIPLNYSLNSFINNIIFKELDSISSNINDKCHRRDLNTLSSYNSNSKEALLASLVANSDILMKSLN